MIQNKLTLDTLIVVDDTGMPQKPSTRQLIDADVRELWTRDKTPDKVKAIAECGVIYQCGDPKSHAKQQGLSNDECLKFAINMYGLPKSYKPDLLVLKLIRRYYDENITEAGKLVENLQQTIHNVNLAVNKYNAFLNDAIVNSASIEEAQTVMNLITQISRIAGDIPTLTKNLETAKQNLMYEIQTESSRGGNKVLSSMDAEDYED